MKIYSFDNPKDFAQALRDGHEQADGAVQPWQAAIKPGDYFVRYLPEEDLVIWGEVVEPDPEDASLFRQPHMKNVRLTRCYSMVCPDGEYGNTHVATMTSGIGRTQFERARERGWPSDIDNLTEILRPSVDRN